MDTYKVVEVARQIATIRANHWSSGDLHCTPGNPWNYHETPSLTAAIDQLVELVQPKAAKSPEVTEVAQPPRVESEIYTGPYSCACDGNGGPYHRCGGGTYG